jgi:PAS domain S-box-containing protein
MRVDVDFAESASHCVQFYDDEEQLCVLVTEFLGEGLRAGDAVVVVSTPEHWAAFSSRMKLDGFNVEAARNTGQLLTLDARDALSLFMVEAMPDERFFRPMFEAVLDDCKKRQPGRIRVYGEMVDLLWQDGRPAAALRLEELWRELQRVYAFSLFCAYLSRPFRKRRQSIQDVCSLHTHVVRLPDSSQSDSAENSEQQISAEHMHILVAEIDQRKRVEATLRESIRDARLTQNELRKKEVELNDFIENGSVAMHWVGPDGKIIWANRAELELLGFTEAEYIGHPIADFHADGAAIDDILKRLGRRETLRNREANLRAKDGTIRHVLISSSVYERDGKFVHTRCFTHDITEQKRLERAREVAAERTGQLVRITAAIADAVSPEQVHEAIVNQVAAALGASTGALWVLRADGSVRLQRAIGYSDAASSRFDGLSLASAGRVPVLDAMRAQEPIWINSQAELLQSYPTLATAVTRGRSYQIACLPMLVQGRLLGAVAFTFDDVSFDGEGKAFLALVAHYSAQALERLRLLEAEQQSRAKAESSAARAELLYTLAAALISAQHIEQVFEVALDAVSEALGTDRAAILAHDRDGIMRFRAWRGLSDEYRQAVEGHSPWPRDVVSPKPVLVGDVTIDEDLAAHSSIFRTEHIGAIGFIPLVSSERLIGKFMVYYGTAHSFTTDEVALASAIANHFAAVLARFAMVSELQETVRFNEMFTGMLGHDLRNPLSAMMTGAQLALERQQDDRLAKPLARILTSGERMARMIDQLLDFTRLRVGAGIPIRCTSFDLVSALRQVLDEFVDTSCGCVINVVQHGQTTGVWDSDRLLQVFSNLLGNALQHGVPGASVSITVDGSVDERVQISVHNMGAIPAALLANLFEPMTGGEHRQEKSQGLGLGLYISREIAMAHGGSLEVQSSDAEGTVFILTLPRNTRCRTPKVVT